MKLNFLHDSSILRLIQIAIQEDVGSGDVTSDSIIPRDATAAAQIFNEGKWCSVWVAYVAVGV